MGGCVPGWNKGSKACGDRAGVGVDVPMVTRVKDGHCGDGRVPYELNEEAGTQIWKLRLAAFGYLDGF